MGREQFSSSANVMKMMEKMIMQVMQKNGMLTGNKTFAVVTEVQNESTLTVEMQQSGQEETVNCTPAIEFYPGDRVVVNYINNNPHDKFVMGLVNRSAGYDGTEPLDYSTLPTEPVEIHRNQEGLVSYFVYGYDNPDTTWRQTLVRDEDEGIVVEIVHNYPDGAAFSRFLHRDEGGRVYKYE